MSEIRQKREELVRHHIAAEMAGDGDAVVATFAVPRYDLVATSTVLEGSDAVAGRVRDLAGAMPDARIEVASLRHADDAVIVETITSGRHDAPLLGVAPTSQPYVVRGVAIFRFDGPDLVEEIVYYDRLTLLDQLRTAPR